MAFFYHSSKFIAISASRFLQDHHFNFAKNSIFNDKSESIVISGSRFLQDHNS